MKDHEVPLTTVAACSLWATAHVSTIAAIAFRLAGNDDAAFCFYGVTLLLLAAAASTTVCAYMKRIIRLIHALHGPLPTGPGAELNGGLRPLR